MITTLIRQRGKLRQGPTPPDIHLPTTPRTQHTRGRRRLLKRPGLRPTGASLSPGARLTAELQPRPAPSLHSAGGHSTVRGQGPAHRKHARLSVRAGVRVSTEKPGHGPEVCAAQGARGPWGRKCARPKPRTRRGSGGHGPEVCVAEGAPRLRQLGGGGCGKAPLPAAAAAYGDESPLRC